MKYKTFKDFLMSKHAEAHPEILDDELPDAFEMWLGWGTSENNIIKYADEYVAIQRQEIVEEIEKIRVDLHNGKDIYKDLVKLINTLTP